MSPAAARPENAWLETAAPVKAGPPGPVDEGPTGVLVGATEEPPVGPVGKVPLPAKLDEPVGEPPVPMPVPVAGGGKVTSVVVVIGVGVDVVSLVLMLLMLGSLLDAVNSRLGNGTHYVA
jgi:hypothetical protein